MDQKVNVFLNDLKQKLIGLDTNIRFIHHHIYRDYWEREELWGGESLTIRIKCILIDKPTVKWIIRRLQKEFMFELILSRYILDPRLKEVELKYRYEGNYEFYIKLVPINTSKLMGLCVYQFDSYGYHVSNCYSSFKEDETKKHILRKNVLTVFPQQLN